MYLARSFCVGLALAAIFASGVLAQSGADFPNRPVRILVPFAAGGPTDVIMRILGDELSARWDKTVIIEDRPGAGTIVATAAAAKALADGYTLCVATNSFVINPAINHALPYDTRKDFAAIGMVVIQPVVLIASKDFPADTVAELVALAKTSASPINYTSPGPRGVGHLAGEMLQRQAGIKMQHISYNGSAPALTDVISGRVPVMFDIWHSVREHVAAGEVKAIAAAGAERLSDAPQYPTIAETFPGFNVRAFVALIAPAGVPEQVLGKISGHIRAVVDSAKFAAKVKEFAVTPMSTSPRELDELLAREIGRWGEIARAANIQVD
jgi:tripartite-type tricarboxylate transporter receptor subunit TctC